MHYATNTISLKIVSPTTVAGGISLPNGSFQFSLEGEAGSTYQIQASTNLSDWITIQSGGPFPGTLILNDTNASHFPHRFYRAQIFD
jgi:hypothetical protein